jgi:hypothetical protein
MSNEWALINTQTGEVKPFQDHAARNVGYRKKQAKENREGRSIDFTVSEMKNLHEVYGVLTTAQCGYLMLLQCYVGWDNGVLVNSDKTPMNKRDMLTTLQLTKKTSTFYDFLKACVKHGIINELDNEEYAVNPRYHFRGAFDNPFVVKSYTTKMKRVYKEVKAADIGLIYRMLPFIHYSTNALCDNPHEQNPKGIRWFNRKELAEAIGVDPDTLGRRLPKLVFDGEYVVARIKLGKEPERYTFNPNVFYRMDSDPDKTLISMFNVNSQLDNAK